MTSNSDEPGTIRTPTTEIPSADDLSAGEQLQREIVKDQNLRNLGKLVGLQSIKRNLQAEDEAVKRDMQKFGDDMHGDGSGTEASENLEGMDILAANDVHIHNGERKESMSQNEDVQALLAEALRQRQPVSYQQQNGLRNALIAGAIAGGLPLAGIAGYTISQATKTNPVQVEQPEQITINKSGKDTSATIRFLD